MYRKLLDEGISQKNILDRGGLGNRFYLSVAKGTKSPLENTLQKIIENLFKYFKCVFFFVISE